MSDSLYTLTVDIATIDALGRNLYSNAAAVLTEFVANSWDADANSVNIQYDRDNDFIKICDDGSGMDLEKLNARFLTVGYHKRKLEGDVSPKYKRPFMGQKGIGKLSAFSIADEITVLSKTDEQEAHGFTIKVDELEKKMNEARSIDRIYHPAPIKEIPSSTFPTNHGTQIKLSKLRSKRVHLTLNAVRRRIARRFDVLHYANVPKDEGRFEIIINDKAVTYEDRGDLQKLEYIWLLNGFKLPEEAKTSATVFQITTEPDAGNSDWNISGWIGSVKHPKDRVFDDDTETMKNIIVLARKRPIQEGLLDHLNYDKHFTNYVTGQIQADYLDENGSDDLATSDRQRLVESDPRVQLLYKQVKEAFKTADQQWSDSRTTSNTKLLYKTLPEVKKWLDSLKGDSKQAASKMINSIAKIDSISSDDRFSLYQSSMIAFTRLQQHDELSTLSEVDSLTPETLLKILTSYSSYEDVEYAEIVRSRLLVINKLQNLLDTNALENTTRDFVASNPWLLDPSWERATENIVKEKSFRRVAKEEYKIDFTDDSESNSRVDLKYLESTDRQVIVEFKRYDRKVKINEIRDQILRYAKAMTRVLQQYDESKGEKHQYPTNERGIDNRVNIIIIVQGVFDEDGEMLKPKTANSEVALYNAKFLYFSDMLVQSSERYKEFIDAANEDDLVGHAIKAVEDYCKNNQSS
ncbi:ATP-binding protein [Bifidobacterium mellis]|uniref:Restriction endonuclease R.BbrII n=1 Tax=Bifidobacterium mellis TaxID=1293823 RepID=A0A0F4KVI3_9BIFI|nr:ATP-binding protein [Bifidobacterium mellis]KJY50390.1 Restriction endonuclease R.BbrII [Bifidobacterium mellis]